jgi:hypothetical protein
MNVVRLQWIGLQSWNVHGASMFDLEDGVPVELGGVLRIDQHLDPGDDVKEDYESIVYQLFAWPAPLDPDNQFSAIELPAGAWDLSDLYSGGTIAFLEYYVDGTGDFDVDGQLTSNDIDRLSLSLRGGGDLSYDLNADGILDYEDRRVWVEDLAGTYFGDADLNQEVDFSDFLALARQFGGPGGWAEGDFDGSGDVQFSDFLLLANNFGNQPMAAAIPEPNSAMLLLVGLVSLLRRGRGRNPPGQKLGRTSPGLGLCRPLTELNEMRRL